MNRQKVIRLKTVVVGNDGSGKTSLFHTFARRQFPNDYIPTVFEGYVHSFETPDETIDLAFWDTFRGDGDEYTNIRILSYMDTDVFILCFDVSNVSEFSDVCNYWAPELKEFSSQAPTILVGCKIDLRYSQTETISWEMGQQMASTIDAITYMEVSSLKMTGLDELFDQVCCVGRKHQKSKFKRCILL